MDLAFCLYKYFPFGGMQRNFLRIAKACLSRGHAVRVYVLEWQGDVPEGIELVRVPVHAFSNIRRYRKFSAWLARDLTERPVDRVVGFNKMPGLDVYYAGDPCFAEKAQRLRGPFYRFSTRYRHFSEYERAVFSPESRTRILMMSPVQMPMFVQHYGTPEHRFHLLPPGIARDRCAPPDATERRKQFREAYSIAASELVLLQIGSGFRIKGVDRSLIALASLPPALRARTRLFIIGQDKPDPYLRQARQLGVADRITFFKGRNDIPDFLLGSDILIHPAYNENTGNVLLEAMVAGLPVLVTAICGFARFISEADAGVVIPSTPFEQTTLNRTLASMLADDDARARWSHNGIAFGKAADIYDMPERAADIILGDGRT
jgi:UDP-glucose:(heptosyl)LPS alpha-1,3-glucosyltransferase